MVERILFGPGGASEATLAAILIELAQKLEAGQAVALDAATLATLENITVNGTVALDAATLAALETVGVAVSNFPVAQTDALTDLELRATPLPVSGFPATQPVSGTVTALDSGEREATHVVKTVTATGDTIVHTPAAGKAIRLRWFYAVNDPTATTAPLINVRLGATAIYRAWALSKRQLVTGPVDGPLVVNLSTGGNVAVTAILEEI